MKIKSTIFNSSSSVLCTLFIIHCSLFTCPAQKQGQARIDSLIPEINKAKEDSTKILLQSEIAFIYCSINPDEGLKYATQAIEAAKKLNWAKGIGNAYNSRGNNFLVKSEFPQALEDYLSAMKFFEVAGNKRGLAGALSNIGNIYGYQSKYDEALDYFFKALKINREIGAKSRYEVANIGNIGMIYDLKKEYSKALEYELEAIKIAEEKGYDDMLTNGISAASEMYLYLGNYPKTFEYSSKALTSAIKVGDVVSVAKCYGLTGTALLKMVIDNENHMLDSLYKGNKSLALKAARQNLDSARIINQQIGVVNLLEDNYSTLSELEEYEGNYKAALEYHKLFKATNDSVFTTENKEKILQTAMQYDFDKKEASTKAEQEKKDIRQKNIRNSITAGLGGALLFLVVVYRQRNRISKEKKRSEELLLNILPSEVAEELKQKGSADAKQFDEVTVMFTDFKGFTQISEKLSPTELVNEIDTFFKAFDEIISKHNIEKIKTIGDSYMCAGGLPMPNHTHATDVVSAALDIQQFMQQHKTEREAAGKLFFEIRIGIHTGPVVAGIVGIKKFAYDIWGDTVNIAARMESSGEPGKVNISGSTYELVKDKFNCIQRGKIQAKNKGEIDMYFVEHAAH